MNLEFAEDLYKGLSSQPKRIPSKYFYDDRGSQLFQQIMDLEEYYPTRCEYQIFDSHKTAFLDIFSKDVSDFQIIEFGAGDGMKTKVLLEYFLKKKADFTYHPVDISSEAINGLVGDLSEQFPHLRVQGIIDDYFKALKLYI